MRFCISIGLALLFAAACNRASEIPIFYTLPNFSLIDQNGSRVTLHDLAGKVWVADFIFTSCGGTCPLMTEKMRKLQDALPPAVHFVSFTVDPARDTSKVLSAYAAEHGANRERWSFLTGDKQDLFDLCIKGFKLPLDTEGGTPAEPIAHSTRFVLVDKKGDIRGYYSGTEEDELKRLAADAKSVAR
jgi:protein SCO1/2